jgi:alpha-methylacyl-CoA racemase
VAGPLDTVRVIELGGIGPGPFAGMMLADNGADVIRVERPGQLPDPADVMLRSRRTVELDLKAAADVEQLLDLVRTADVLIEGFRPGTLERLNIGPNRLHDVNPRLVIGRMTGWGQNGSYAAFAGHDINYISISGALHAIGPAEMPVAPPALVGDFGGGGMVLAFAVTAAVLKARETGIGQIIDCAMCDGSAVLMSAFYSFHARAAWHDRRSSNLIDGGAHFYGVYETLDSKFISIGAIEPQFYALLLEKLALAGDSDFLQQMDEARWPELRTRLQAIFRTRTRDEWCLALEHTDVCFAPVLGLSEAPHHPHMIERGSFLEMEGVLQPAPVPRYSATPLDLPRRPRRVGDVAEILGRECIAVGA